MKTSSWCKEWEHAALPDRHKRVLSAVTHFLGANGGEPYGNYPGCFVSAEVLGRRSGYHERQVRQILTELEGGWLSKKHRPGRSSLLFARLPGPDWVSPPEHSGWELTQVPGHRGKSNGHPGARAPKTPVPGHLLDKREGTTPASGPEEPKGDGLGDGGGAGSLGDGAGKRSVRERSERDLGNGDEANQANTGSGSPKRKARRAVPKEAADRHLNGVCPAHDTALADDGRCWVCLDEKYGRT